MSISIDTIDIAGLKKHDVYLLRQIFYHFKNEKTYWGRKDYFDMRMRRLEIWIDSFESNICGNDIKIKASK